MDNEIWSDEGGCKRCGRKLTDELSIERGYGPVCHKKVEQDRTEAEFLKNQMTIDEEIDNYLKIRMDRINKEREAYATKSI